MRKTILKHFTEVNTKTTAVMHDTDMKSEQLTDLLQELKPFLKEASNDLLQPRQEALAALFSKALN